MFLFVAPVFVIFEFSLYDIMRKKSAPFFLFFLFL